MQLIRIKVLGPMDALHAEFRENVKRWSKKSGAVNKVFMGLQRQWMQYMSAKWKKMDCTPNVYE